MLATLAYVTAQNTSQLRRNTNKASPNTPITCPLINNMSWELTPSLSVWMKTSWLLLPIVASQDTAENHENLCGRFSEHLLTQYCRDQLLRQNNAIQRRGNLVSPGTKTWRKVYQERKDKDLRRRMNLRIAVFHRRTSHAVS